MVCGWLLRKAAGTTPSSSTSHTVGSERGHVRSTENVEAGLASASPVKERENRRSSAKPTCSTSPCWTVQTPKIGSFRILASMATAALVMGFVLTPFVLRKKTGRLSPVGPNYCCCGTVSVDLPSTENAVPWCRCSQRSFVF